VGLLPSSGQPSVGAEKRKNAENDHQNLGRDDGKAFDLSVN
jgi:hypothetical protein